MFGAKRRAREAADRAVGTWNSLVREYAPRARRDVEANRTELHRGLTLSASELEMTDLALMAALTYRAAWDDLPERLELELGASAHLLDEESVAALHRLAPTSLSAAFPGVDVRLVEVCLKDTRFQHIDRDDIYSA